VLLALGRHQVEVSDRALVVGVVDGADVDLARRMVADGADALLGPVEAVDDVPLVTAVDLEALGATYLAAPEPDADRASQLATQALAITRGARVVATRDVRGTRRVADVLAAILART
jgi:hypothetical protein